MGNTITEPVMPNDMTTHRTVGGGVKVHVGTKTTMYMTLSALPSLYLMQYRIRAAIPRGKIMILVTTPMQSIIVATVNAQETHTHTH